MTVRDFGAAVVHGFGFALGWTLLHVVASFISVHP